MIGGPSPITNPEIAFQEVGYFIPEIYCMYARPLLRTVNAVLLSPSSPACGSEGKRASRGFGWF